MEFTLRIDRKTVAAAAVAVLLAGTLAACNDNTSSSQKAGQQITEQYSSKLAGAQPYPLSQMNDSDERANLRERLLRFNNPAKIGYLAELTQNGQVFAYFTIKGKVSSTASQLTPSQNINYNTGSDGGGNTVTESMGDDGSYGPEECGATGVFFFDTAGVMHEWCGQWAYSDAPMNLRTPPLIVQSGDAKPSTTAGQLK
jgi:predicted small secreted protein